MKSTIVRYWAGWFNRNSMDNPMWLQEWKNKTDLANTNNEELVVFSIPKNKNGGNADHDTVEKIELLLQERFGTEPLKRVK